MFWFGISITKPQEGDVRFAEGDSAADLEKHIDGRTKAVFCESIGNPAGNIVDLQPIADMAHSHGVATIVDNTVPTPALLKPVDHGWDIVVHSMTKYMGGHGNSLGGVIVDGGKFDWSGESERYPMFTTPEPSYHGVVYTDALVLRHTLIFVSVAAGVFRARRGCAVVAGLRQAAATLSGALRLPPEGRARKRPSALLAPLDVTPLCLRVAA